MGRICTSLPKTIWILLCTTTTSKAFLPTATTFLHTRATTATSRTATISFSTTTLDEAMASTPSTKSTTTAKATSSLKPFLEILIAGERHLSMEETEAMFDVILSGTANQVQVGSLLTLLRARQETPTEIAGMVKAMNRACNAVMIDAGSDHDAEAGTVAKQPIKLLDIVGTGGDGADTINISTASVVLSAACGCIVAKAGNRSVSSRCGSADVLEALGVRVDLQPADVVQCVKQCNVAFMYAPINHPAMKHVAPVRSQLGVRTCFNILGPLTNAAGAQHAVIGVFHPELMPLMAGALQEVGRIDHAVIVHGVGLDEISPLGPAEIIEIKNIAPAGETKRYDVKEFAFDPLSIGIPRCDIMDLKGGGPDENAEKFRQVLLGGDHTDAKRDAIVLNAGMGCYVYGLTDSIENGCKLARETLESGKATELLQRWIEVSQAVGDKS